MISIDRGSHPLPSGECCQEDLHCLVNGGYGLRWLRVTVATGAGEQGTVGFQALT